MKTTIKSARRSSAPARDSEDYMYKLHSKVVPNEEQYREVVRLLFAAGFDDRDDFELKVGKRGTSIVHVHRELPRSAAGKKLAKIFAALPDFVAPKRKRRVQKVVTCPTCGCVRR